MPFLEKQLTVESMATYKLDDGMGPPVEPDRLGP